MSAPATNWAEWLPTQARRLDPWLRVGRVVEARGMIIESVGPDAGVGDLCMIQPAATGEQIPAEVVGFAGDNLLLMPFQQTHHIHPGTPVMRRQSTSRVPVGPEMIGRVLDGLGQPIDGRGMINASDSVRLYQDAPNPLHRRPIDRPFGSGVRAIDLFMPCGEGQRFGIFAGSGVGKSTLLGMIARNSTADVNVVALIGERGRELGEFLHEVLGEEGLRKSVLIVSTGDQAPPLRVRAAFLATAVAEYFRDRGQNVLLMMDSLTRLALAQREIGLAVGEPPTARGFTPSVFSMLPRLLERAGQSDRGSITGAYTVLVEGDDFSEPVTDTVRGILDGHILLSRDLASEQQWPAIDVLGSLSRLSHRLYDDAQSQLAGRAREVLARHRKYRELQTLGAYERGRNPELDRTMDEGERIWQLLRQSPGEPTDRLEAFAALARTAQAAPAGKARS
ncbi:MAG: FliI/YscN family ATPase [Opitutales bacterium]